MMILIFPSAMCRKMCSQRDLFASWPSWKLSHQSFLRSRSALLAPAGKTATWFSLCRYADDWMSFLNTLYLLVLYLIFCFSLNSTTGGPRGWKTWGSLVDSMLCFGKPNRSRPLGIGVSSTGGFSWQARRGICKSKNIHSTFVFGSDSPGLPEG